MKNILLTVSVLSYNRPEQLKRLLKSLKPASSNLFKVVVHDDCSPQSNLIQEVCSQYKGSLQLLFMPNSQNLGYDGNLINALDKSSSKYCLLMSDDDYFDTSEFIKLLSELKSTSEFGIGVVPYFNNGINRNHSSHSISSVYDFILFSGLIFNTEFIRGRDFSFLDGCIYSQVYIAQFLKHKHSVRYFTCCAVKLGNDGENFFGVSDSYTVRKEDSFLSDRQSPFADLSYQSKLRKVFRLIDQFDSKFSIRILPFYLIRLLSNVFRARIRCRNRSVFLSEFKEFIDMANNSLSIKSFLLFFSGLALVLPKSIVSRFLKLGLKNRKHG